MASAFLVVFCLAALLILLAGCWQLAQEGRARQWPQGAGVIVNSEVTSYISTTDHDASPRWGSESSSPTEMGSTTNIRMHRADIRYEYRTGPPGEPYRATASLFHGKVQAGASSNPASAEALVRRFPVGQRVSVYYDPQEPTRSTLDPALYRRAGLLLIVIGGALLAVALILYGFAKSFAH